MATVLVQEEALMESVAYLALGLAVTNMLGNILLFCAVMALSKRVTEAYPMTEHDLDSTLARVDKLSTGQSNLWRVMEALDDHTGADAHRVLRTRVPHPNRQARQ